MSYHEKPLGALQYPKGSFLFLRFPPPIIDGSLEPCIPQRAGEFCHSGEIKLRKDNEVKNEQAPSRSADGTIEVFR